MTSVQQVGGQSISNYDVVFGRSSRVRQHPANVFFRSCINERANAYKDCCSNARKTEIAQAIMRKVFDTGGRFLKQIGEKNVNGEREPICEIVDEATALRLTKQRLIQGFCKHQHEKASNVTSVQQVGDDSTSVSDSDVILLGTGTCLYQRPSNLLFRSLIRKRANEYQSCGSDALKDQIAQAVMRKVFNAGGRFLQLIGEKTVKGEPEPICEVADEETALRLTKQRLDLCFRKLQNEKASNATSVHRVNDQSTSDYDVIFGRDSCLFQRPANALFLSLIQERATDWHGGNDARRDEIALETVRTILDTCGRFLKQVGEQIWNGELKPVYEVVDESEAVCLTKHRFYKLPRDETPPSLVANPVAPPSDHDVIFGNSRRCFQRPANILFRSQIRERAAEY